MTSFFVALCSKSEYAKTALSGGFSVDQSANSSMLRVKMPFR